MTGSDTSARRDAAIIALIALAHFNSHFFQLVLPPLFPLVKAHFDVSYTALGSVMSVFFAASGIGQAIAGFLVDRFGGRRALIAGTAMLAGGWALASQAPEFWMLYPLALLAGIGNSVYHPADYAILSHGVMPPARMRSIIAMSTERASSPMRSSATLSGFSIHRSIRLILASRPITKIGRAHV